MWLVIPRQVQGLFENIKATLSSEKNYQTLRTHLRTMSGPCIPYLGTRTHTHTRTRTRTRTTAHAHAAAWTDDV